LGPGKKASSRESSTKVKKAKGKSKVASLSTDDEDWYDRSCKVTLSKVGFGYTKDGFVSSSGYGDGAYDCIVYKKDGKAIAVEVTFIDYSNKDEDMPDMEPSDDPWEGEYSWDTE
jgi:hypothetical protein